MRNLFAIDIETVTQGKRADEYTSSIKLKAPSNYKNEDKIKEYIDNERDKLKRKHSLHCATGKIISIAVADVFGNEEDKVMYGHDEVAILNSFSELLVGRPYLIGMFSNKFDFGFLVGRYMANDLEVPPSFRDRWSLRDVDEFFGFSSAATQRTSLNGYAHLLGLNAKPMNGGDVADLYNTILLAEAEGDDVAAKAAWVNLRDYNLHDTNIVKEMARRYYGKLENVGG